MRMHVPLASLGTLLDLPAGTHVVGVELAGDGVDFTLAGEIALDREAGEIALDRDEVAGGDGDEVTAEYAVDAKSHRSFVRFKLPGQPVAEPVGTPEPEVPVTETIGATTPAETPKPAGRGGRVGS